MIHNNILDTIGATPLVKINNFKLPSGVEILAKIEGVNPGGSVKDRIALKMIKAAISEGRLTRDHTIIEATSGNTGISIAMIAAVLGYRAAIVMSEAVSIERRKIIAAFGSQVLLSPADQGTDGAIKLVRKMAAAEPERYCHLDQYSNVNNKLAHYENTAQEIIAALGGEIDYFVAAIGTSGTLMGVAKYLREYNPRIKIVSAEPEKGHFIQGLKNMEEAIVPDLYDRSILDDIISINTEEAYECARQIARREGIFAGMSSGAALLACLKLARQTGKGRIVTIFPDRGEKYLSTKLFVAG